MPGVDVWHDADIDREPFEPFDQPRYLVGLRAWQGEIDRVDLAIFEGLFEVVDAAEHGAFETLGALASLAVADEVRDADTGPAVSVEGVAGDLPEPADADDARVAEVLATLTQ